MDRVVPFFIIGCCFSFKKTVDFHSSWAVCCSFTVVIVVLSWREVLLRLSSWMVAFFVILPLCNCFLYDAL